MLLKLYYCSQPSTPNCVVNSICFLRSSFPTEGLHFFNANAKSFKSTVGNLRESCGNSYIVLGSAPGSIGAQGM